MIYPKYTKEQSKIFKIYDEDIEYIKSHYIPRHPYYGQRALGRRFGVDHMTIRCYIDPEYKKKSNEKCREYSKTHPDSINKRKRTKLSMIRKKMVMPESMKLYNQLKEREFRKKNPNYHKNLRKKNIYRYKQYEKKKYLKYRTKYLIRMRMYALKNKEHFYEYKKQWRIRKLLKEVGS